MKFIKTKCYISDRGKYCTRWINVSYIISVSEITQTGEVVILVSGKENNQYLYVPKDFVKQFVEDFEKLVL